MEAGAFLDSLCVCLLEAKYFPQGNLLDTAPAADGSQTGRGVEYGLELLKLGCTGLVMGEIQGYGGMTGFLGDTT
jgi:hypothetical protein